MEIILILMHEEFPNIVRLQIHLLNQQTVVWNENTAVDLQSIVDEQGNKDTTLTGYFKANIKYPEARDLLYQDFSSKFVWDVKKRQWTKRKRGFVIGRMRYVHPNSGQCFYLCTLLCYAKGATSFEDLRTVNGVLYPTFHAACLAHGLLEDDNKWRICLQEAAQMASGCQLRDLFVTILCDCSPSDPLALWLEFRVHTFNMLFILKILFRILQKSKFLTMAFTLSIKFCMVEIRDYKIGHLCLCHKWIGPLHLETD